MLKVLGSFYSTGNEHFRCCLADLRQPGWAVLPRATQTAKVSDDGPPRLLVADQRALAWLLRTCGPTTSGEPAAALVSAAPTPVAVAQRQPLDADTDWPTAHPVTAALEEATPGLSSHPDARGDLRPLVTARP